MYIAREPPKPLAERFLGQKSGPELLGVCFLWKAFVFFKGFLRFNGFIVVFGCVCFGLGFILHHVCVPHEFAPLALAF